MSILIKGMEMPKDCRECPVVQRSKSGLRCPILSKRDGFSRTTSIGAIGRMNGCLFAEVPTPHGSLIDIDSKITVAIKDGLKVTTVRKLLNYTAVRLPKTVIEAEDGDAE